jgi:hypothetical protein
MKMKLMKVLVGTAAALAFSGPASAAITYIGTFDGTDCAGDFGDNFGECEYEGSPIIAKYDGDWEFNAIFGDDVSEDQFSGVEDSIDETSGTFSYDGEIAVSAFVLKAGQQYAVYEVNEPSTSFTFDWSSLAADLVFNGNAQGLSHISFYDTEGGPPAEVPLPAAAWLFMSGLIPLAGFMRKRRAALEV